MKKAIVIVTILGLWLVGLAFHFADKSKTLLEKDESEAYKNAEAHEIRAYTVEEIKNELANGNSMSYKTIELSESQFAVVNPCMKLFYAEGKLDAICAEPLLDVIINDFDELGFINAIIGSSINYDYLSYNFSFVNQLHHQEPSLKEQLILEFLNRYRNPNRLAQTFNKYKNKLYSTIPKSMYQRIFEKQINECLSAYQEIAAQNNKEAFFEDIYFKADSQYLHGKFWKYTFWKRRELEKTDEVVFKILSEIKQQYSY